MVISDHFQSARTKFKSWMKKYEKMEDLLLEFEARAESDEKFRGFLPSVQERMTGMSDFKKTFQKFQLAAELALRKVAAPLEPGVWKQVLATHITQPCIMQ